MGRKPPGGVTDMYSVIGVSDADLDVPAASVADASVTVPGVTPGDGVVFVQTNALAAGLMQGQARCDVAGTVIIPFANPTAGALNNNVITGNVWVFPRGV